MRVIVVLGASLIGLALQGCEGNQPFEPKASVSAATLTSGAAPTPPSEAAANAISFDQIDVSWQDNSRDEDGFEVARSTSGPSGAFTLLARTLANAVRFSDGGLSYMTQYCYEIRALSVKGAKVRYSAFSSVACATTPAPPSPTAPLYVRAIAQGSTVIYADWWGDSLADGFRVQRSLDNGLTWTLAATTTEHSLWESAVPEQPACYRVIAFNVSGDAPPTAMVCATPLTAPTNLTATIIDDTTTDLAWTDNSGLEDGYDVWVSTDCDYPGEFILTELPANATSYRDSGTPWFSPCRVYTYWVVAFGSSGQSDPSNVASPQPAPTSGAAIRTRNPRRP